MQTVKTAEELKALTDKGPVVVDFGATWCPPCNKLVPVFSELSQHEDFKGKVTFVKVDIDEAVDLTSDYGILTIPTLIVFKEGKQVAMQSGLPTKNGLAAWIKKNTTQE